MTRPMFHPTGTASGGGRASRGKLILAGMLLLAAGIVAAINFGLFGGNRAKGPPPLTPEAQAERDEAVRISKERHEQLEKDVQQGGGRGPG
ncbi:MAG: hypothetical protein IT439_12940 [Phycisphaerales bacterium]|nr:hypothetical protein [Phycisphaerales bacterium]